MIVRLSLKPIPMYTIVQLFSRERQSVKVLMLTVYKCYKSKWANAEITSEQYNILVKVYGPLYGSTLWISKCLRNLHRFISSNCSFNPLILLIIVLRKTFLS
jgi:hypothetical protein